MRSGLRIACLRFCCQALFCCGLALVLLEQRACLQAPRKAVHYQLVFYASPHTCRACFAMTASHCCCAKTLVKPLPERLQQCAEHWFCSGLQTMPSLLARPVEWILWSLILAAAWWW
jgi:hypothetical protein